MAIDYRAVDADSVADQVKAQRAAESEGQAYASEMEIVRLEAVASKVTKKEDKDALKAAIAQAKDAAKEVRKRANRLNKGEVLGADGVTSARVQFLQNWITSLEQEHVAHTTVLAQRQDAIMITGIDAPSDAEKADIQRRMEDSAESLLVIESSWNIATEEYDKIVPQEPVEA